MFSLPAWFELPPCEQKRHFFDNVRG